MKRYVVSTLICFVALIYFKRCSVCEDRPAPFLKLANMSKKNEKISIESLRVAADLACSARTPKPSNVHNRYIFRLDSCGRWFDSRCQRFLFVVLGECGFYVPPDYVRYALLENDRFKAKYRVFGGQITLYINPII